MTPQRNTEILEKSSAQVATSVIQAKPVIQKSCGLKPERNPLSPVPIRYSEEQLGYIDEEADKAGVIKDGRQHFHVMWCRVSVTTGKAVWPGHHWLKSKQVAREMETELGLKRPIPRKAKAGNKVTSGRKAKLKKAGSKLLRHLASTPHPRRDYAGLLGETTIDQPKRGKSGKTGKGDGAGGGATSAMSALKSSAKSYTQPIKKYSSGKTGKGNGPERRRKNMWVPVERREQGPK